MKKKLVSLALLAIIGTTTGITLSSFLAPTEDFDDHKAYMGVCTNGMSYILCGVNGYGCTPTNCH